MLVQISIPVLDYCGDGIAYQNIYFDCEKSPTKDQVLSYLKELHDRDKVYPEYLGDWQDCIQSVEAITEWKEVGNTRLGREGIFLLQTSSNINREELQKIGNNPHITWKVIQVKNLT